MTPAPAPASPWNRTVAAAFDRAASTYDAAARVQQALAGQLAQRICQEPLPASPRVLEVGCGTGFLTAALAPRLSPASWQATDIAPAMVDACAARMAGQPGVTTRVMDAEAPDVAPGSVDLVCSSLAGQWFSDLPGTLRRLHDCLAPGGLLALTILGPETFEEWRDACAAEGLPSRRPAYPTADTARSWLGDNAWVAEEWKSVPHPSARAFLADLKAIGAQTPAPDAPPAPPGALRRVLRRLEGDGFDVTYHILTLRWRKEAAS